MKTFHDWLNLELQEENDFYKNKDKWKALKELAMAVRNGDGLNATNILASLKSNTRNPLPGSTEMSNFRNFLKQNVDTPNGKMSGFNFLIEITSPANFEWLKNPKTYVTAMRIAYEAIPMYKKIADAIQDPKLKYYALKIYQPMKDAYLQLHTLSN
jgi:hypothetical protein